MPVGGGGGPPSTLWQVAEDLANRMIRIFTRDAAGRRPVYGHDRKFQEDPHWRDLILFHEYFHGDTGEGLGRLAPDRLDRPRRVADRRVAAAAAGVVAMRPGVSLAPMILDNLRLLASLYRSARSRHGPHSRRGKPASSARSPCS